MKSRNVSKLGRAAWCQALIVALSVICLAGFGNPARANLVQNGFFTSTTLASPGGYICAAGSTCSSNITAWSSSCNAGGCGNGATVASLLFPSTNGSAFNGGIGLWSISNPPTAGNIIAIDGDQTYTASLSQTITGLTPGESYQLQFYQAAAQQLATFGPTTEQWKVSLGGETQLSTLMDNASQGFVPWNQQTMTFTASAASEVLTFMALGTPQGEPPVVLLDAVSLTGVPEPATVALLGGGLLALFTARKRIKDRARN
jgi:hypothetical protein